MQMNLANVNNTTGPKITVIHQEKCQGLKDAAAAGKPGLNLNEKFTGLS